MDEHPRAPLGRPVLTRPFQVCAAIALIGLFFLVKRFVYGIGAVSNMSDGYPWASGSPTTWWWAPPWPAPATPWP